jgi:hypothetical protein
VQDLIEADYDSEEEDGEASEVSFRFGTTNLLGRSRKKDEERSTNSRSEKSAGKRSAATERAGCQRHAGREFKAEFVAGVEWANYQKYGERTTH